MVIDERALAICLEELVRLGKTNKLIVHYLNRDLDIRMSVRTLKRYLRKFGIRRIGRDERVLSNYLKELVRLGKTNKLIVHYLNRDLDIRMSVNTLRNYLQKFGLRRIDRNVAIQTVQDAVVTELQGSGANLGYRALAIKLRVAHNLRVSMDTVRLIKNQVVPAEPFVVARAARRAMKFSPGPNFRWSADGHDKLQAFGIYIHACIDVFSRKIIWCHAFWTNRHQPTIATYYLDAVERHGVAPFSMTADFGAETDKLCRCQVLLWNSIGAQKRMYSTNNNPIERFWCDLQRLCTKAWAERFETLQQAGLYAENSLTDRWAVHAVLLPFIQQDIDEAINAFHQHRVRFQKGRCRPSGKPEDLYNFPEAFGKRQCGLLVSARDVDAVREDENVVDGGGLSQLPDEVRQTVDEWLWATGAELRKEDAIVMYLKVRRLLVEKFGDQLRNPVILRVPVVVVP